MADRRATKDQARLAIRYRAQARNLAKARRLSNAQIVRIATSGIHSTAAAKLLGTTPTWVSQLARRGELACVETPLGRLYDREDVLRFAEARRVAQAGRPRRGRPRRDDPRYQQEALSA